MKCMYCASSAVLGGLFATVAMAAPIVDGTFDAPNYNVVVTDTPDIGEDFLGTGLDINRVGFALTSDSFYIGLETILPLDVNGDPTTFGRKKFTAFWVEIATVTGFYFIDTATNGAANLAYTEVYWSTDEINWSLVTSSTTAFAVGTGLELQFDRDDFTALGSSFTFMAQLDGLGEWDDDQIGGEVRDVPEPATAILFAAGAGLMAWRRKR